MTDAFRSDVEDGQSKCAAVLWLMPCFPNWCIRNYCYVCMIELQRQQLPPMSSHHRKTRKHSPVQRRSAPSSFLHIRHSDLFSSCTCALINLRYQVFFNYHLNR